jgi:predicted RND superfamily exporter protein
MQKFGLFIARHRVIILIIGVLLLFPATIGFIKTQINYDLLTYLPRGIDSVEGENILDKDFSDAATGMLVIRGMSDQDVQSIKGGIAKIGGVERVVWKDDLADISIPESILPDSVSSTFSKGDSTLLLIQFKNSASSTATQQAVADIRQLLNKQCFLSGMSAIVKDTVDLANAETPRYVILAVLIALCILSLAISSWTVPPLFLLSIGMGIMYNLGSNIMFGQISYITKALAAVLQLGVTMDFAIFLYNRYERELAKNPDKEQAMASAIANSFTAVFGSGLATTCGFMALGIMRLGIGRDIGFVMAKGVFLSVISTFTILPALLLVFNRPIHRFRHKTIMPSFKRLSGFVVNRRALLLIIGLVLLVPAYYGQANAKVYYNLEQSLPSDMQSVVSLSVLKKDFNMATTHMILVHDTVPAYKIGEMEDEIGSLDGINTVIGTDNVLGPGIPSSMLPSSITDMAQKDGYKIVLANSGYQSASGKMSAQLSRMNAIVKKYDPKGMITGEGALTNDLISVCNTDFKNVSVASILVVLAVVLLMFTSLSLPIVLVCAIELAIFINMGIPFYTGSTIPFIASIVIGCIQLAATVDYAILLSSSYREHIRNGETKQDAMRIAVQHSTKSILTSALTFFGATFGVYLVSTINLIKSLTLLIARGALISTAVIVLILPGLLMLFEPVLEHTSLFWKHKHGGSGTHESAEEID